MAEEVEIPLPEQLAALSWLVGSWEGVGLGHYPTIEPFRFLQQASFSHDGRPFLSYSSRSWLLDDAGERVRPAGAESGFVRPTANNECEMILSHPTGITELWFGRVEITELVDATITGARIEMSTDGVMRSPAAKEVSAGHRLYGLVAGELLWTYDMAAVGQELQNHLSARLKPLSR